MIAKSDVIAVTCIAERNMSQATVEGSIPLPADRTVRTVLCFSGNAQIRSAEVMDRRIRMDGRICIDLLCEDMNGELFSFSTSAAFSHSVECEEAREGQTCSVMTEIISAKTEVNGDAIDFSAVLDIVCRITDCTNITVLGSGTEDMEILRETYCDNVKTEVGTQTVRLREEIVAANVESIIAASGNAVIRDVVAMGDGVRADGILSINALGIGMDGQLTRINQNIPFSVDIPTDFECQERLIATVEVTNVSARPLGEEFGLLAVEATVEVTVYSLTPREIVLPIDAYSPSEPFNCMCERRQILLYNGNTEQKAVFRETVHKPQTAPDIFRGVYLGVRPIVTSASYNGNGVTVDGIAFTTLVYEDKNKKTATFTEEVPYSVDLDIVGENIELDATALITSTNISASDGESAEISFTIHIRAAVYSVVDTQIAVGATECEKTAQPSGFIVCFAGEGESLYALGKRMSVSRNALLLANPNLKEPLHEGDKAVLLV